MSIANIGVVKRSDCLNIFFIGNIYNDNFIIILFIIIRMNTITSDKYFLSLMINIRSLVINNLSIVSIAFWLITNREGRILRITYVYNVYPPPKVLFPTEYANPDSSFIAMLCAWPCSMYKKSWLKFVGFDIPPRIFKSKTWIPWFLSFSWILLLKSATTKAWSL